MSPRPSQWVAIATGYGIGIAAFSWVPPVSIVPGRTLAFGRPLLAFLLPTAALAITIIAHVVWHRDRSRQLRSAAASTHEAILLRVVIFIVAIHGVVLLGLLSVDGAIESLEMPLARIVPVLLGLLFVTVGNLLPRTEPNLVIGIRIRKTMTDACIWKDIHRLAGYVTVTLGAVLIAVGIVMTPGQQVAPVVGGAGMAACIVIASYAYSRGRSGHHV